MTVEADILHCVGQTELGGNLARLRRLQGVIRLCVAILVVPDAIFIERYLPGGLRRGLTVADARGAGGNPQVLAALRSGLCGDRPGKREEGGEEQPTRKWQVSHRHSPLLSGPRSRRSRRLGRVGYEPRIAVRIEVQTAHFVLRQGLRAAPPDDRDLASSFIDGAVAVQTFRQTQRWFAR